MTLNWWLVTLTTPLELYSSAPWIIDLIILCAFLMAAFHYAAGLVFRTRGEAPGDQGAENTHPMARRIAVVIGLATGFLIEVQLLRTGNPPPQTLLDYIGFLIFFLIIIIAIAFWQFMREFTADGSGGYNHFLAIGLPVLFGLMLMTMIVDTLVTYSPVAEDMLVQAFMWTVLIMLVYGAWYLITTQVFTGNQQQNNQNQQQNQNQNQNQQQNQNQNRRRNTNRAQLAAQARQIQLALNNLRRSLGI
ncbi:MAG: hypothetical protein QF811_04610 [Candidatus Woesearchaeota archaeon]|nr:hypothetical protein [Candidatus Woesearchaeota archaeon]